jgi:hypothetical protein
MLLLSALGLAHRSRTPEDAAILPGLVARTPATTKA